VTVISISRPAIVTGATPDGWATRRFGDELTVTVRNPTTETTAALFAAVTSSATTKGAIA
jgi:hypothetical protein